MARALILEPEIIIIDDALGNLDASVRIQLLNLTLDLQQSLDISYIYVGQDLGVIKHIADTVIVMDKGKMIKSGTPKTLFTDPQTDVTGRLVESYFGKILDETAWVKRQKHSLRIEKMNTRPFYFGLIFIAIIAILANYLGNTDFSHHYHISALIIAILLGMAIGNTIYPQFSTQVEKGVLFAKGTLLRTGIVLYGFRLTFGDIADVGLNAVVTDAIMLISTFFFTALLGIRYLKMDKQLVYLTGAGCSICGAAAVMAAEPVTKAESHKVSVAIAVVVIFGTLAIFTYPLFYTWSQHLIHAHQFGIYVGSSVHEVAQVYAIGENIDPIVANTAVISKMIRVMMLAPFLLMLSWLLTRSNGVSENTSHKITIPWFAVLFIGVAIFNSFDLLPKELVKLLVEIDSFLLISAMAALGLTTQASAIKKAGLKPLILGILIYLWLVVGGFLVNYGISKLNEWCSI